MRIAIIGGSGIEDRVEREIGLTNTRMHEPQTPFGAPSGPITTGNAGDVPVAFLQRHGPGHTLPPHKVPYRANIYALKTLGVTHVVATGAVGSLRDQIPPGVPVLCDGLIDRTTGRDRTFYDHAAVHVEFADPFCPVMRRWLLDAAPPRMRVRDGGTYVAIDGPSFSTRAESYMHRSWGGEVVGMTAAPEARLAREAEIAYALLALPTDYDCWKTRGEEASESLIEQVMANLAHVTDAAMRIIARALRNAEPLKQTPSPAHDALRLAIWTDRSRIEPEEVERLRPLWGRHFT